MKSSVKGMVFDIRRHSLHDGPGIRTAFFMKGCPLSCLWCHNPEGLGFGPELQNRPERCIRCGSCESGTRNVEACPTGAIQSIGREIPVSEALKLALADECFYNSSGGGITFTGGEPLAQGTFLLEATKSFKNHGLTVCLDTSGYAPEELVCDIAPYLDLVLYDLKHMDDQKHRKLTGVSNEIILANARKLASLGVSIQFSIPLIPGLTDDDENLLATARFISELARTASQANHGMAHPTVRILPYHGSADPKYSRKGLVYPCRDLQVPDSIDCEKSASFFLNQGLETVIGGLE